MSWSHSLLQTQQESSPQPLQRMIRYHEIVLMKELTASKREKKEQKEKET
jgi:hypothetical protein